ncbi:MAG: DUF58 domain-containing protein [Proteobacteria bacterium]|nr:DUF58 domain-containing protein [Pseudomonadota bacterium]HQR02673.1 DUF58 domain-containing protein [Rhodocyclaceae bacterium]
MSLRERLRQRFFIWALRGRPPEPSPVLLTQRRVYVLPTRPGLAFGISLIIMLIGAINYSLSLGHGLVFLLAGLGISTILATFRNLVHLRIEPGHAEPVFAGDPALFGLILRNTRDTGRPQLRVWAGDGPPIVVDIPGNDSIEALLPVDTRRRGWLSLPRVTLETVYPLGLIRTWAYAAPAQRCLIYPAPAAEAPPLPTGNGDQQGRLRQNKGNDDFIGLRNHQAGESLQHVAWKAAARQPDAPLLAKQFGGESALSLYFDWDALPPDLDVEQRLSILVRWICDAHRAGMAWGLRMPPLQLEPDSGDAHFHRSLKILALHGQS